MITLIRLRWIGYALLLVEANAQNIWAGKFQVRAQLENIDIGNNIILKWFLGPRSVCIMTGIQAG
jgi:hypothetical protein